MSKIKRPDNQKIADIKVMRTVTWFLGKLGIKRCKHVWTIPEDKYDQDGIYIGSVIVTKESYGWGLKEAKDYIESKYEHTLPPQPYSLFRRLGLGDPSYQERAVVSLVKLLEALDLPLPKINLGYVREAARRLAKR